MALGANTANAGRRIIVLAKWDGKALVATFVFRSPDAKMAIVRILPLNVIASRDGQELTAKYVRSKITKVAACTNYGFLNFS